MKLFCPTTSGPPLVRHILLVWAISLMVTQPACANEEEKPDAPEFIDGVTIVNAEGLIEKVLSIPDMVLIDSRIVADRKQGFIEGSISLPDIETSCDTLAEFIASKPMPVMFYCNGVKCGRSAKAAQIAVNCDYTTLYWFRNGIKGWEGKGYPLVQ
jgi:rhodanese-related sulfurtransferase